MLFGDEREDYAAALKAHYENPRSVFQESPNFISHYASVHPLEDWAEGWARYLHIVDTLETAAACGLLERVIVAGSDGWLDAWSDLSVTMNELTRSMGADDAYPFVLSAPINRKLEFIHRQVGRMAATTAAAAAR